MKHRGVEEASEQKEDRIEKTEKNAYLINNIISFVVVKDGLFECS